MPATAPPLPTFLTATPDPDPSSWFHHTRTKALERAQTLGLPDRRNEDYRFTDLAALNQTDFVHPTDATHEGVTDEEMARFRLSDLPQRRMVFVDGRYHARLSDAMDDLPEGVTLCRISEALDDPSPRVRGVLEKHLGHQTLNSHDAFIAHNHAKFDDGFFLHVPPGVQLGRPLYVVSLSTGRAPAYVAHTRNLVVAEDGALATVVERFVSLNDEAVYFNNAVTELVADTDATLHHYLLEQESEAAFNMSALITRQHTRSNVHSHTVLLGGRVCRNSVVPVLTGERAHCLINGLYVGHGEQVLDNAMIVVHAAEACESRQFYKGILNDQSRGNFAGRIKVLEAGQQTDAVQSNRSMLLSDDARAIARPQLEIYADDVKCTHGCTTGEVDPDAVFYFKSRGIPEETARAMLIFAFAAEAYDRMELIPVRKLLAREMIKKLPGAETLSIEINED